VHACLHLNGDVPPQWRNQKQSDLVIPHGGCISLQAEGMDTVSLRKAVLSTNETGVWRNETEYAFLWRQDAVYGFDNFGTATYEDGVLYAPSKGNHVSDGKVYAINASNGNIIWNITVRQCDASPCIDGDVLYMGECDSVIKGETVPNPKAFSLNKTNGEEIWYYTEPDVYGWVGSPLVHDDYVYYTTFGSGVYALNKTNGKPIWHQEIGDIVCSVAYNDGAVFVSVHYPPSQYAFNATTGDEIWHVNYGASWDSSPIIYDGMAIQVTFEIIEPGVSIWSTCVLNETTGELIRKFEGKGSPSTPLVHDDKLFIPSDDWRTWAFDLITGDEMWHTVELHDGTLQNHSYCSPAAAGGAIYYQSLNGTFYVINETDGGILWSYPLEDLGFGSPSIGDGCVFITNDFALYAFKIGLDFGDWPMFCQNNLHRSFLDSSNKWITAKFIWCNKTITSAAIAWRIYFFDNAGNVNATDIKIFYVETHDIAIVDVVPEETTIEQNQTMSINVTVVNEGDYTETFNVTLYYDSTQIGFQTLSLNASESTVLTFEWNTTGVPYNNYTLSAHASKVPVETDTQDNTYSAEYPVTVIPEFPSTTIIIIGFIVFTLIVVVLIRKGKTEM